MASCYTFHPYNCYQHSYQYNSNYNDYRALANKTVSQYGFRHNVTDIVKTLLFTILTKEVSISLLL
ncbi:MAG: hypothetical protein Barrevirus14_9 [Barrevirus sp.]|uniref:Uncharacterized protein n=1 Tax=Barrevirus sp. TaxID=2487763 RepID=A0A3G4ZQF8_9VIRU|nr:MAG: hypothetical protein Barrevirus14_9 [Barrevirus sp.]